MATTLPNPFTENKDVRVATRIPAALNDELFVRRFPLHGAPDRIIAILLHHLYNSIKTTIPPYYDPSNERILIESLDTSFSDCRTLNNGPILND